MDPMTAPARVDEQYADETRLTTRRSVWHPAADGRTPQDVAAAAVRAAGPRRLLEVGSGLGDFAVRLAAENPDAEVTATDRSPRFVEVLGGRGLTAREVDVQALPFGDASYDVVVAMWMLYHVPDLDRGLAEVRRVLRPGGTFVAVTNGRRHTAALLARAGQPPSETSFTVQGGAQVLGRHFDHVEQTDLETRAVFADHAQASAYLASFDPDAAAALPPFDGPFEDVGDTAVFTCR